MVREVVKELTATAPAFAWERDREDLFLDAKTFVTSTRFVPRSGQIGDRIPIWLGDLPSQPYWTPSDVTPYHTAALEAGVDAAGRRHFSHSGSAFRRQEAARHETLQRSRLMEVKPRCRRVEILSVEAQPGPLFHRCYVYRRRYGEARGWNVSVYRWPNGPLNYGYTQYLRGLCLRNGILEELTDSTESLVTGWAVRHTWRQRTALQRPWRR
jgi:hypothetical protein